MVPVPYASPLDALVERLRPPGAEAWAAILAIGHKASRESLNVLADLMKDADWRYRRSAVEAVAFHPRARLVIPLLVGCLQDPCPFVVRTACTVVAELGLEEAHDSIVGLLRASDPATRESAVRALSSLWHESDFEPVFRLHREDPERHVRRTAAWTLFDHASSRTWRRLFEAWRNDPLPRHRVWACQLVSELGEPSDAAKVSALLNDPDGHVRKAAKRVVENDAPAE